METAKTHYCKTRLEAAKLRTRAAHQDDQSAGYARQSQKPAYDGQAAICQGKQQQVSSLAAENRAKADLIEAEAEAAYLIESQVESYCLAYYESSDLLNGEGEKFLQAHKDAVRRVADAMGDEAAMGAHAWCELHVEAY